MTEVYLDLENVNQDIFWVIDRADKHETVIYSELLLMLRREFYSPILGVFDH
jgi:hypothetical protein